MTSRRFAISILLVLLCNLAAAQHHESNLPVGANAIATGSNVTQGQESSTPKSSTSQAFNTAYNYVVTFYPRWFTFLQPANGFNRLLGPVRISPIYQAVVAINDDTLYGSAFFSVTNEPAIVSIPSTTDIYSVLVLDQYGSVLPGITAAQPGQPGAVYALIGPGGWNGTLPAGAVPIYPGVNNGEIIFRADKFIKSGNTYQDMRQEADSFRRNICLIPVSQYSPCPNPPHPGQMTISAERLFGISYKRLAVNTIASLPLLFLSTLQTAVHNSNTNPLTPSEQTLSNNFDALFQDHSNWPQMAAAAQAAHAAIDVNYVTHTLAGTTWVNFTDIGNWAQDFQGYLNRSGITDYLQFGNNASAAVYFHAFADGNGVPLNGSANNYVLTFQLGQQPDVQRFWSLTAYVPVTIELGTNSAGKYVVASYTPHLVTAPDGSVSVVMAVKKPAGVPKANWLPIPNGPFSLMLRAYGPNWNQQTNPYTPPPIQVLP